MPLAKEIWIEKIRPGEEDSIVASFDLFEQAQGDPAGVGKPFAMPVQGIGEVWFQFVCCIKGQAIYSATLPSLEAGQGQSPEPAQLIYRELLRVPL